ncbi:mechanosensitive ion channel family protein [Noviherbaspirillum galbum]|uniref:Mechanosensitive ion channel n=1 Tax=Noviherbaspirillum galbum TaxID=2709383 RepID=A0A6B3STJ6_9BURK|nr:mechanosensitive ion channel domain-containing protein [Noviherbaspirillum galbum]NEX64093.1 mechanosensitive ion channel [Noviherbaspirillum galbum]
MDRFLVLMSSAFQHDPLLFHIGKTEVTLSTMLTLVVGMTLLVIVSGWLRGLIADRLLAYGHVDVSTRYTIGSLVRYLVLVVGTMILMQTAGINLTALSVLAGAVGVGVGFGLQNIVSNFISGLIVMFERPVKIGDRVELGGVEGDVIEIGARATRLMTAEGSVIIMPNQKFITDPVKNWADGHDRSPLVLNLAVGRGSDMREVAALLHQAVDKHYSVEKRPAPQVLLTSVTGAATFRIIVWVNGSSQVRNQVMHELYLSILEALAAAGIALG